MRKPVARKKPEATQGTGTTGPWSELWFLESELKASAKFTRLLLRDADLGMQNTAEFDRRKTELGQSSSDREKMYPPLSHDFPRPRIRLTETNFAPDYFFDDGYDFCSQRPREALAQPEDVVQFVPVDLIAGGEAVAAQNYAMMHILAQQPVMDLAHSDYDVDESIHQVTGKTVRSIRWVEQFVLLEGLKPRIEIFHLDEVGGQIMVTDALAARVLRAGCTGLEFRDPAVPQHGMRVERVRTRTGITERRVGFLD